jgi:anti-sigma factor RsiW
MEVTRNVIQDLLPIYLGGEASAESRALVDEFLKRDPALAADVERQKSDLLKQTFTGGHAMSLPQDLEVKTLARTRAELTRRSWMLALAIAFTLFPLSIVVEGTHVRWLMLRDVPSLALAFWAAAAGFWVGFIVHNKRLRSTGL